MLFRSFSPSQWFEGAGLIEPVMRLNLPGALVAVCVLPLFVLIVTEYRQRGPRPAHVSAFTAIRSFAMWPLMAPSTFFFASMPSLHAQLRLGSGAGLVYRVAEKGSREEVSVRLETDAALGGLEQSLPAEVSHDRRRVEQVVAERAG